MFSSGSAKLLLILSIESHVGPHMVLDVATELVEHWKTMYKFKVVGKEMATCLYL